MNATADFFEREETARRYVAIKRMPRRYVFERLFLRWKALFAFAEVY